MTLRFLPVVLTLAPLALLACDNPDGDGTFTPAQLVQVTDEPAGEHCAAGGQALSVGHDDDANGSLDSEEIETTTYVCNGADGAAGTDGVPGAPGADGTPGADGAPGADGTPGADGGTTLVALSPEDVGDHCASGGTRVDVGLDADGDGELDAGEVASTAYVCAGADGAAGVDGADGAAALIELQWLAEAPGCAAGGTRVDAGPDTDGNGELDAIEVQTTAYVCDGADGAAGADGHDSLLLLTDEDPGANCLLGGLRVDAGVDDDGDHVLAEGEIDQTSYVCKAGCGDGTVQPDEICDVGADNGTAGSGCTTSCSLDCVAPLHGVTAVKKTRDGAVCWVRFDGAYDVASAQDAWCATWHGYPARILAAAENADMADLTGGAGVFWIGLRYVDGAWGWANGDGTVDPMGFQPWTPGMPVDSATNTCGGYNAFASDADFMTWANGDCSASTPLRLTGLVCEVPL